MNPGGDSPAWVEHLHFVGNDTGLGASDSAVLKTSLACWEQLVWIPMCAHDSEKKALEINQVHCMHAYEFASLELPR